jgi:hypothetical protein
MQGPMKSIHLSLLLLPEVPQPGFLPWRCWQSRVCLAMYCCPVPSATTRAAYSEEAWCWLDCYKNLLALHTCCPDCKSKRHRLLPHCTATSAETHWTSAALLQPQQTLQTHTQSCERPIKTDPGPKNNVSQTLVPPSARVKQQLSIYFAAVRITLP